MSFDAPPFSAVQTDDWLEEQCRKIGIWGERLSEIIGEVNQCAANGRPARRPARRQHITEEQLRQVEEACAALHEVQLAIQNILFDCEHELRELRERDISPVELLVDGERLILRYRFLRRRARVVDGLLAFLPTVNALAGSCLETVRRLRSGAVLRGPLAVPDCGFALVALDELHEEPVPVR